MHWYKKAQYSVEKEEAHPIPATTDRGSARGITKTDIERESLPETPKMPKKKKRKQPKEKMRPPFGRSMPYGSSK